MSEKPYAWMHTLIDHLLFYVMDNALKPSVLFKINAHSICEDKRS